MTESIESFTLDISDKILADLNRRLDMTRWPERETVDGWQQGVPLEQARALCAYWRNGYDWRRCESRLNGLGQYRTRIDGLGIHFLHIRSPEPDALPMLMTHGWPGSIIEFLKVIGPLTDPRAYGGDPAAAFHLVLPSLPGYGFSDRPSGSGWPVERVAKAWIELMARLGYDRFVAQGGDWGSAVTTTIGRLDPPGLAGIHLNMVIALPGPDDMADLTATEKEALADVKRFSTDGSGYSALQSTRPQTLGYGLTDSPVGQAMWIYEKLAAWTDSNGDPSSVLSLDEMLDNIMLYWLPATAASSARLYWESFRNFPSDPLDIPVACSVFPKEAVRPSRRWAERKYPRLIHFGEPPRGGHFAAWEQPVLFTQELRTAFASLR